MTLPIWAGTFAVFAGLMVADLALTQKAVGLRAAATSSALWIAALVAIEVTDLVFAGGAVAASLWRDGPVRT